MQPESVPSDLALPKVEVDFSEEDLSLNLDPRGTRIVNSFARTPRIGRPGHAISPVQPVSTKISTCVMGYLILVSEIPLSFQQWISWRVMRPQLTK
jgi:hypothetical protein